MFNFIGLEAFFSCYPSINNNSIYKSMAHNVMFKDKCLTSVDNPYNRVHALYSDKGSHMGCFI